MTFQNFQQEDEYLNRVAKEAIGPDVKVKDSGLFRQFINFVGDTYGSFTGGITRQNQPLDDGSKEFIGPGGYIDPQVTGERFRETGAALASLLSRGTLGDEIFGVPVEMGNLFQGPIDVQDARDFGAKFGTEIPEAIPFVGGQTPAELAFGTGASLLNLPDIALTGLTAGAGPTILRSLGGTGAGSRIARTFLEPVAGGPFQRRLAAETAIQAPTLATISGTEQRQLEGIAQPFENTFSALAAGVIPTAGGVAALSRRNLNPRIFPEPPVEAPSVLRQQQLEGEPREEFLRESLFPDFTTAPSAQTRQIFISPNVEGTTRQPATRLFPQQFVDQSNQLKTTLENEGATARNEVYTRLSALNANAAQFLSEQNRNLQNLELGYSPANFRMSIGSYFGTPEPSIRTTIENPANSELSVARIVDIGDKDLKQDAIIIVDNITSSELQPRTVTDRFGTEIFSERDNLRNLTFGETIEPGVTRDIAFRINFSGRLNDEDIAAIDALARQFELPGFSVGANYQSIDYNTLRAYNPDYINEIRKLEEFGQEINNYFRRLGRPILGTEEFSPTKARLISREPSDFSQSYTEYRNNNANRLEQILESQGIKQGLNQDGSIDFEAIRLARPQTPEQLAQPIDLGAFGQNQRKLIVGGDGTDIPEDIFKNLPKNLIDDKEFVFRLQYVTDAEKEFLRPFLDRANARARRGEARVLTESEIGFVKRRFLARTNSRINEDFRPWETGNVQPERRVTPQEIGNFLQDVAMFIPNTIARTRFLESFVKLADRVPKLTDIDIKRLRRFFGKDNKMVDGAEQIVNDPRAAKPKIDRGLWNNSVFLAKAIRGTLDFGAVLRQNAIYTVSRPFTTAKSFGQALKAALSDDAVLRNEQLLEQNPNYNKLIESGMRWNKTGQDVAADRRAEAFMSDFIEKLPKASVIGPILRASARFHTHFLNNMRFNVANQMLSQRRLRKATSQAEIDDLYRQVSEIVNIFTGEADLKTIPIAGKKKVIRDVMYQTMWAPRLWWSRIYLPISILKNPIVRNEAALDLAKFIAVGGGILTLANMDPDIRVNYRKGEIAFEDGTKFKIWGGFEQFINYAFDLARDYKTSSTGTYYKVGDMGNLANRWWKQTSQYMRGKANPVLGELIDHISGEDFFGEDAYDRYKIENWKSISSKNPAIQSLAPLVLAEIVELIENTDDPYMIATGAAGAMFGVNVNSYTNKEDAALDVYNKRYVELEPFEQRVTNLHYYAEDTTRSVPESYKSLSNMQVKMKAIFGTYNNNSDRIRAYYDAKAESSKERRAIAQEEGFDYDDPFYKNQIRNAGTDAERAALETYYSLMEQTTTEDGLFLYDDFNRARDTFLRGLTKAERSYISRNTNFHAETIPQELFRILPGSERKKLLDSINERAKLDRLTLQPIDQQIKDSFESLADKIESQED